MFVTLGLRNIVPRIEEQCAHLSALVLSLSPGNGYILCSGIPDCFTTFDSKNLEKVGSSTHSF